MTLEEEEPIQGVEVEEEVERLPIDVTNVTSWAIGLLSVLNASTMSNFSESVMNQFFSVFFPLLARGEGSIREREALQSRVLSL